MHHENKITLPSLIGILDRACDDTKTRKEMFQAGAYNVQNVTMTLRFKWHHDF